MDVTIREMVLEDLDAVGRLEHEAFEHPLSVTAFRSSLRNRYKKNFVAVTTQDEDRKIAGVCTMRKTPEHVWISNVCVTTRMQGCGIARAMLEHAITTLTQDGWHRFILKVRPDNETALALYRSLGFTMNRNMTADCINFDIYELNC